MTKTWQVNLTMTKMKKIEMFCDVYVDHIAVKLIRWDEQFALGDFVKINVKLWSHLYFIQHKYRSNIKLDQ